MFTGLIQTTGKLASHRGGRLEIRTSIGAQMQIGESISVSGICLTVVDHSQEGFHVDVSPATAAMTAVGYWKIGQRLNLERALCLGDRLGGHLVTGHVDGIGQLNRKDPDGNSTKCLFELPGRLARAVLALGSIAIDGVSLTVCEVGTTWLSVVLIPETLRQTALGSLEVGQFVNLETDLIGKYVQKLLFAPYREGDVGGECQSTLNWPDLAGAQMGRMPKSSQ